MVAPMASTSELEKRASEIEWYHTIELAQGLTTPGWFDTRPVPEKIGFPVDLRGKRCLDIATFDGFWAFTMERRGAAEIVAIDVPDPAEWDWPANSPPKAVAAITQRRPEAGFALASQSFGSRVDRREVSVYDLDPAHIGMFDFVYVGSLLLHLRDPVGALMRVRRVCDDRMLLVDAVHEVRLRGRSAAATLDGSGRPWWWKPNVRGLVRMVEAAGFEIVAPVRRIRIPAGRAQCAFGLSTRLRSCRTRGRDHSALR